MSMRHWSYAELEILKLLSTHPTRRISYDGMAAQTGIDRRTVISAIARLRERGRVLVVQSGRGREPHHYNLAS